MLLFSWLERKYEEAIVRGTFRGMAKVGLIEGTVEPGREAEAIREAIAAPEPVTAGEKPTKRNRVA